MKSGDSQTITMIVAADDAVGNCKNCSVLYQSLNEYVSSFLALKQKISAADDSVRLQQQVEELKTRLAALTKKAADYDSLQAELKEKTDALKAYGQMSEEIEKLKQENDKTMAEKNKLEDQLKEERDLTETNSRENAHLKSEKAKVEQDFLKTQTTLKKCQAQADKVEHLIEEKTKMTSLKDSLENKVRLLEESVCEQDHQISQLNKEKILSEINMNDLQVRLLKLERERIKEYRSTSTQASTPEEPKVDKGKFRMLLQNLWTCLEPQQQHSENLLLLPESSSKQHLTSSPLKRPHPDQTGTSQHSSHRVNESQAYPIKKTATFTQMKTSPDRLTSINHQETVYSRGAKKEKNTPKKSKRPSKKHKTDDSCTDSGSSELSFVEVLALFKPMLPCISPIPEMETEMVSMETDEGERPNYPRPSDGSAPLQQEESLLITTPETSQCIKSSAAAAEENVDLSHKLQRISNGNHFKDVRHNELSSITETHDRGSTDGKEVQLEKDLQTEQEPTTVSASSSSTSDNTVEVVSLSSDQNVLGKIEEHQSVSVTKNHVNTSPGDNGSAKMVTTNIGESSTSGDITVISEEAGNEQLITPLKFVDSVRDAEVTKTENCSEIGQIHQDSCGLGQSRQNVPVFESRDNKDCLGEDTEVSNDNPFLSNIINSVSNVEVEEWLKTDASMKALREEDGDEAQETGAVDGTVCHFESTDDNSRPSPHKSPLLKMQGGDSCADKDPEPANTGRTSKTEADIEESNGDHEKLKSDTVFSSSDSEETKTPHCQSLNENSPSLCRTGSPSCLSPTIGIQALPIQPNLEEWDVGVNDELIGAHGNTPQLVPNIEEEVGRKCKFGTISPTTSLKQDSTATNGEKKHSESCSVKHSPQTSQEEEKSPVQHSTTAQPEYICHLRSELGPPLPRLLTPVSTPPKAGKSINPRQAIEKLSFPSPTGRSASPTTPDKPPLTLNNKQLSSPSLNSPVRPNKVPSSPLQFGSATPKHAVPVPGRLPLTAMSSSPLSSSNPSKENSMRILDTMYPELSAHARTLSILKGNLGLSICSSESGTTAATAVSQMSGFKAINSTPTAFTKTETKGEKRPSICLPEPKHSKCIKLDDCSSAERHKQVPLSSSSSGELSTSPKTGRLSQLTNEPNSQPTHIDDPVEENLIANSFKKLENQCFDVLPVLQSHLHVGNLPKKPVLRSEEKEVISEICQSNGPNADDMMIAVLNKLKAEKRDLSSNYMQALCRVYTGICRQRRDWEKAHFLAYSILTEDFPDAAKLILFMVTTWPSVLSHSSPLCRAIHAVTKLKAPENLLHCLTAFLGWKKNPPCNIDRLIEAALSDIRSGSSASFTKHIRHGDDLGSEAWEHVFTLHILCAHKKWQWTYENVLGKELWPLMNAWVTQPRDQKALISDVTVATVLRLIGLLGQLGMKERCTSTVITVASVINMFGRHGPTEGIPWEVQLAAIYSIFDLSPCNPKEALDALAGWRGQIFHSVPPSVMSCINQLASICRLVKTSRNQ